MSEFTNTKAQRLEKLVEVSRMILETGSAHAFITGNRGFIETVIPSDFITLFDELIKEGYPIAKMKLLTNKVLNIFHLPISNYKRIRPESDSFLGVLERNNTEMEHLLNTIRPVYKAFVKETDNKALNKQLLGLINELEVFVKHYTIKENVLFPAIELSWPDYRCLQIMWSFHDDIRQNIKTVRTQLLNQAINFRQFNRCIGDLFFNMLAIKFREERILFPHILSTINEEQLDAMNREGFVLGFPYFQPPKPIRHKKANEPENGRVNLGTGELSIEQIKLVFNHLPVDITYVDEHDKVLYFSTPKKRIFPRTAAIVGREVSNCHPPESVYVVEQIIQSFKTGEKDKADFWIQMKGEFILIQYFAVRNAAGKYRGVIEVSQEITEIKALEGEKRLLNW